MGFVSLATEYGIELIDLNTAPLEKFADPGNVIFPEIFLPKIVFNCYLISLPVLKAHSLAGITGTLKNMMGLAPPRYYSGGGGWKKAFFHRQIQDAVIELNRYRTPDLTILDASVGLSDYHLGGPVCHPSVNKIVASDMPLETDQYAAGLLGLDADRIKHINTR